MICVDGMLYLYQARHGYFEEISEQKLAILARESIPESLDKSLSRVAMMDVYHRLRSSPSIQVDLESLDQNVNIINFKNGVYDCQNDELVNHSPAWLLSSYINADFLKITEKDWENSRFKQFLHQCTGGNTQKIASLQEVTAYIISNHTRAKKFFVLLGVPHSGKSVWLTLWQSLIGKKHTSSMSLNQLCNNRFMLAELVGARLNISAEMNEKGFLKGIEVIKAVTGGDLITGERKGGHPFHFYAKTKLVAAGNHMPIPEGLDGSNAFVDRILFLMFEDQVSERDRDRDLITYLIEEREIIVQWALEGLKRLSYNNLIFTESVAASAFRAAYSDQKNSVSSFVHEMCELSPDDSTFREHRKTLLTSYRSYCHLNCLKGVSDVDFFNQLAGMGLHQGKFRKAGSAPLRGFIGIRFLDRNDEKRW